MSERNRPEGSGRAVGARFARAAIQGLRPSNGAATRTPSPRGTLIEQLGDFYNAVYEIDAEMPLEDRAHRILVQLARVLQLSWVALWRFDWETKQAVQMTLLGKPTVELSRRLPMSQIASCLDEMSVHGAYVMPSVNVLTRELTGDATIDDRPVLAVPIPAHDYLFGVWVGQKRPLLPPLSNDDLEVAVGLTGQFASIFDEQPVQPSPKHPLQRLQLEAMIEDFNGAVSAFDLHGCLTYINEQECELFDLNREECWVGQDLRDFLAQKRRLTLTGAPVSVDDNPVSRALRGERVEDVHQMAERKNGERRYIRTSARPIYVDGHLIGAVSISKDLTQERSASHGDEDYIRQLEHALRRSQAVSEIVLEINENAVAMDRRVVSTFAIERICSEFNADKGMLWLRDDDNVFRVGASWPRDISEYGDADFEAHHVAFAGPSVHRVRPLVVNARDVRLTPEMANCFDDMHSLMTIPMMVRGQQTGLAILGFSQPTAIDEADVIFASVWGRQMAQGIDTARFLEVMETAHNRLVAVVDQLSQAVVVGDAEAGRILVANDTADAMWGFHLEDGMSVTDLPLLTSDGERIEPPDNPMLIPVRSREARTGEPLIIMQPDGTQIEVIASHAPVFDARKRVTGFVSVFQNRSDFKMLDRSKDEFISVVAHELRNPLTSLRGNLQLLQRRVRKRADEHVPDELGRIDTAINQADRIADLVSRMLDVSRVDMGSLDVSPEETDVVALLHDVVSAYRASGEDRHVTVNAPDELPVVWDEARIQQVLSNLLQNTARYAPGTPVEIDVREQPEDRVTITVRDHGPGVPAKIRRRLFKQYFRFDDGVEDDVAGTTDGSRGLGIGLYVSARLIRQHGGTMTVHNHREGGAVFTITLPRNAPARDESRA